MKTIKKETALFLGIALGVACLAVILLWKRVEMSSIIPYSFFTGIILIAAGLLLFSGKRSKT